MGLDIIIGEDFPVQHPRWAYSGFHRFRKQLAAAIGIELDEMHGFRDDGRDGRPWSEIDSPLVPLLDHSDCDGEISPEDCARVAPALRKIVTGWTDPEDGYDREMGLLLADFMEEAARTNTPLVFT